MFMHIPGDPKQGSYFNTKVAYSKDIFMPFKYQNNNRAGSYYNLKL